MNQAKIDVRPAHAPLSRGASLLSWLLLIMGLVGIAPCVLVPEWLAYQRVSVAEQQERRRLADMERRVAREAEQLEAIQANPEVVARLAQRELNFIPLAGTTIEVPVPQESPIGRASRFLGSEQDGIIEHAAGAGLSNGPPIEAPRPPRVVSRLIEWLPALRYDRVFSDYLSRTVIMAMSVIVLGVAFWMVTGRRPYLHRPGR